MSNDNNNEVSVVNDVRESQFTEGEFGLSEAEMIEFMLSLGVSAEELESKMGAASGHVRNALQDVNPLPKNPPQPVLRLLELYWREQIKGLFRRSPFIGAVKGAKELGLQLFEFRRLYGLLIKDGKLKYRLAIPSWVGAKKMALRKHVVID